MSDRAGEQPIGQWPANRSRRYANDLAIGFNLSEVELCFGQAFAADGTTKSHSWILTTPVHLVSFGRAISRTLASYEDRYGRIPVQADDLPESRQ